MSINVKTKEVEYIDDCRGLSYLECMGLIFDALAFKKFDFNYQTKINDINYQAKINDINFTRNFLGCLASYTFYCDPEKKTTIIDFNINEPCCSYLFYFVPKEEEGIEIQIKNSHLEIFAVVNYNIEQLQDYII